MKNLLFTLLVLGSFLTSAQSGADALIAEGLKKYELESAEIVYEISGEASGSEVFTFDKYGWRSVKRRMMSFTLYDTLRTQEQHELTDGKIVYRIDHKDSTYRKRMDIRWSSLAKSMNPAQVSESILFSLGGTYAGDSTLLGKTCQVWTFQNRSLEELWVWKGLTLKRKSRLGPLSFETIVTELKLDDPVDAAKFSLPPYSPKE